MTVVRRQQGMTFISLIFVLCIIGFFAMLILKIGPIYLDHSKITAALESVKKSEGVETKSEYEIRQMLGKRFNLNYVYDVSEKDIAITKSGNYLKIEIQYDVIKKIMGNLSVLIEFDDVAEVGQP